MLNTRGSLSSDGNNKKRFESLADEARVCLVSKERERERERERDTSTYDRRQSLRLPEETRSVKILFFSFQRRLYRCTMRTVYKCIRISVDRRRKESFRSFLFFLDASSWLVYINHFYPCI